MTFSCHLVTGSDVAILLIVFHLIVESTCALIDEAAFIRVLLLKSYKEVVFITIIESDFEVDLVGKAPYDETSN